MEIVKKMDFDSFSRENKKNQQHLIREFIYPSS